MSTSEYSEDEATGLGDRKRLMQNLIIFGEIGKQKGDFVSFTDKMRAWRFDWVPVFSIVVTALPTLIGVIVPSVWPSLVSLVFLLVDTGAYMAFHDRLRAKALTRNLPPLERGVLLVGLLFGLFIYAMVSLNTKPNLASLKFRAIQDFSDERDGQIANALVGDVGTTFVLVLLAIASFSFYRAPEDQEEPRSEEDYGVPKSLIASHAEADEGDGKPSLRRTLHERVQDVRESFAAQNERTITPKRFVLHVCTASLSLAAIVLNLVLGNARFLGPLDYCCLIFGCISIVALIAVALNFGEFTLNKMYSSCLTIMHFLSRELLALEPTTSGRELMEWMALRELLLQDDCLQVYAFCSYIMLGFAVAILYFSFEILIVLFGSSDPRQSVLDNESNVVNNLVGFLIVTVVLARQLLVALKIWKEQSRHSKLLDGMNYGDLYGKLLVVDEGGDVPFMSQDGHATMERDGARKSVIAELKYRMANFDDGPLVLGVPLKPTVVNVVLGYLASACVAIASQLIR